MIKLLSQVHKLYDNYLQETSEKRDNRLVLRNDESTRPTIKRKMKREKVQKRIITSTNGKQDSNNTILSLSIQSSDASV